METAYQRGVSNLVIIEGLCIPIQRFYLTLHHTESDVVSCERKLRV